MVKLFLVRHGKSAWNKLGLWTGWVDVDLDEDGIEEARKAGEALLLEDVHVAYTSELKRTHQTFEKIKEVSGKHGLDYLKHPALNERNYGIHTGKNKWDVKNEIGDEEFQKLRRGWDVAIPEGETLKDVYDRVIPYFQEVIIKDIKSGKNVLIVAHGNTLRALTKHIESLDEEQISEVEFETGVVHCYNFDEGGSFLHKEKK